MRNHAAGHHVLMVGGEFGDTRGGADRRTARPARAAGLTRLLAEVARHATVLSTVGTSFAVLLLQTVQAMVLARMLGPGGRGEYASAILYTTLLTYIGLMGTHLAVARRAARHRGTFVELQRASLRTGLLTGTLTLAVVAALGWTALPATKSFLPLCASPAPWPCLSNTWRWD